MPDEKKQTQKNKTKNKKSLYKKVLDEAQKADFEAAADIEGLDDEITLLRVLILDMVSNHPENTTLIMKAADLLAKLVKTRHSITDKKDENLGEAIKNIIRDIGVPLGVQVLGKKL